VLCAHKAAVQACKDLLLIAKAVVQACKDLLLIAKAVAQACKDLLLIAKGPRKFFSVKFLGADREGFRRGIAEKAGSC
jgi:hypothetical protein